MEILIILISGLAAMLAAPKLIAAMKKHGLVDSGDALTSGIGAMSDARMASFFSKMVRAGVIKGTVDFRRAYSLQFVNKGVGVEPRPKK